MPSVLSTAPEIQGQEIESQRASYTKKQGGGGGETTSHTFS